MCNGNGIKDEKDCKIRILPDDIENKQHKLTQYTSANFSAAAMLISQTPKKSTFGLLYKILARMAPIRPVPTNTILARRLTSLPMPFAGVLMHILFLHRKNKDQCLKQNSVSARVKMINKIHLFIEGDIK